MDERARRLMLDGYAAVNRGDLDAALEAMDADIEFRSSGAFLDDGDTYHGRSGVRRLSELGDRRVFVRLRFRGRGKESGIPVDLEGAHVWTLRDYKAIRLDAYSDLEKARAAAGLT